MARFRFFHQNLVRDTQQIMDDTEERIKEAIDAGESNLHVMSLLKNWCYHAEIARSSGRGMVETQTGLPIGHMGVQCKYSKKNTMHCWLLEDAAYDFYLNNCVNCKERVSVKKPDIMDFVAPRERAREERNRERERQEKERELKRRERISQRKTLRDSLTLEETFVLDLLDAFETEEIASDDPRLEQLANLAPESFTRRIIDHLLPAVLNESLTYSIPAAKALLRTTLEDNEKLRVSIRLLAVRVENSTAIETVLLHADALSSEDLEMIFMRFVSMAINPPPGLGSSQRKTLNANPVKVLYDKRGKDIDAIIGKLFNDSDHYKTGSACRILLALERRELFLNNIRNIISKLPRRRLLLRDLKEDSDILYFIRKAATKCLTHLPEDTDQAIQGFLEDRDEVGRIEAYRLYRSVLKYEFRTKAQIGQPQRLAFKRLLWAALENPGEGLNEATGFLRDSWSEYSTLAIEHFDDLIGAAANLSEKYKEIDEAKTLELADNVLSQIEKDNKRRSIISLQGSFVEWAAVGARSKGVNGIEDFLSVYRRIPVSETQMRGRMVLCFSKLLSGVESLNAVLPDWYRALMDEDQSVRSCAIQSWENVPYDLVENIPDLFFEALSITLIDPYCIVHCSAVTSLRRRAFPKEKRGLIKEALWNLTICYSKNRKDDEFTVDRIDSLAFLCLSTKERQSNTGLMLSHMLLQLEDGALYQAINQLHYRFGDVPGYIRVALKAIQSNYTRSISIDDCVSVILMTSKSELKSCVGEFQKALRSLQPFKPILLYEILVHAAALTRAGEYLAASEGCKELINTIPSEPRHELSRMQIELVALASEIEHSIECGNALKELITQWYDKLTELSKENEERSKLRDFPPNFLF